MASPRPMPHTDLLDGAAGDGPGGLGEPDDRPGRVRRQPAGRDRQVGRRGGDRLGLDAGRGRALLGGRRQRGVPAVANRRSRRPPDPQHPFGHGREAYVWSLFAALGLFVAGAAVSVTHGIQELITPEPASDFLVGYVVLAVSFVLEGISFLQSIRQAKPEAESLRPRPHRARPGHLRPDPAGGLRRGRGRAGRPGHRRRRARPAPDHRLPDPGRDRLDPGRRAARRRRDRADQPQPAVPGRAGGRPAGAGGGPAGAAGRCPRSPG